MLLFLVRCYCGDLVDVRLSQSAPHTQRFRYVSSLPAVLRHVSTVSCSEEIKSHSIECKPIGACHSFGCAFGLPHGDWITERWKIIFIGADLKDRVMNLPWQMNAPVRGSCYMTSHWAKSLGGCFARSCWDTHFLPATFNFLPVVKCRVLALILQYPHES